MDALPLNANDLFGYYALGEKAVTIVFGDRIDPAIPPKIRFVENLLKHAPFPGLLTTVAAYTTLCIQYDPFVLKSAYDIGAQSTAEWIFDHISILMQQQPSQTEFMTDVLSIPVCYGGEYGPDLEHVAAHTGLSASEIIKRHTSTTYLIYMMGFLPGFPYLGGLDPSLATPRKTTPQQKVPAGSVGIAGAQTGIYPLESPGGWQLIGRTPLPLFDPEQASPILLRSGQEIRFEAMDHSHFDAYRQDCYGNKTS
ncbi:MULTISPECIES: 5-oxoprolinase subunit PxpB [Sphingobacterium]|uniref:5-oxoprolinase subunit PxpB n=1 Tax=Sphingobacterium populi TaxID=1812824 RepID=A0ABW5U8M7_9SPHI|nr:5-oxoprolinase subunit PxpB [Sphingobacterium sp. CFCC 11742]